jgi:hypothetical protein
MPLPQIDWNAEVVNPLIADQLNYDCDEQRELAERQMALLNLEQRAAFDKIVTSVRERSGKTYFLNGPGGTRKTFVYKTSCHLLRSEQNIVLCVASSGITALLMPGGRTAHSVFKIPIDGLNAESFCNIPKNSHRADMLRRTVLIIWDEIGMLSRLLIALYGIFSTINALLAESRSSLVATFSRFFRWFPRVHVRRSLVLQSAARLCGLTSKFYVSTATCVLSPRVKMSGNLLLGCSTLVTAEALLPTALFRSAQKWNPTAPRSSSISSTLVSPVQPLPLPTTS